MQPIKPYRRIAFRRFLKIIQHIERLLGYRLNFLHTYRLERGGHTGSGYDEPPELQTDSIFAWMCYVNALEMETSTYATF